MRTWKNLGGGGRLATGTLASTTAGAAGGAGAVILRHELPWPVNRCPTGMRVGRVAAEISLLRAVRGAVKIIDGRAYPPPYSGYRRMKVSQCSLSMNCETS